MDSENSKVMSMRLSRVLGDIGVNRYMIAKRRRTWKELETMRTFTAEFPVYHFGSQSEGTTTPGMQSDIDTFYCLTETPVILYLSEWKKGEHHLLVIKTEESPPQHCWLQRVRRDLPVPELQIMVPSDVIDRAGRVFKSNTMMENHHYFREHKLRELVQHGPSRSLDKNRDNVFAYHCDSFPEECKFLFQRPRPGHWPRPDTLAKAKGTGVFLVPQGYKESPSRPTKCRSTALHVNPYDPYYPMSNREWRFSTSMMERLLIFDMTTKQLKVYVTIKIIRKTFFKPIVGDRLSTFHIKTAMMFTIETYPPDVWRKDNLVQCVIYCLTTLRRWLNIKFCPNYTIAGVNLFTGKLFSHEFKIIAESITSMIASNLQCIYQIEMDSLGARMSALSAGVSMGESFSRYSTKIYISYCLIFKYLSHFQSTQQYFNHDALGYLQFKQSVSKFLKTVVQISEQGTTATEREVAAVLIFPFRCTLATVLASRCIEKGRPITPNILNMYQMSVDSDLLTRRLKFPSLLYCSGQYVAAENYLTDFEALLGPQVCQFCICKERKKISDKITRSGKRPQHNQILQC